MYKDSSKSYLIIGAAMEVHGRLGPGFLEAVYQGALAQELRSRGVPCLEQAEIPVFYKGTRLPCGYRADFVCFGEILLEIKAVSGLCGEHLAQVLNYLRATGLEMSLLINFGRRSLEYKRVSL